jgi:hypothetical protein
MDNSQQQSTVRRFDVDATPTVNRGRYDRPTALILNNPTGLPIAFRRVAGIGQPGSFLTTRVQVVTPRGVSSVSRAASTTLIEACHPLN